MAFGQNPSALPESCNAENAVKKGHGARDGESHSFCKAPKICRRLERGVNPCMGVDDIGYVGLCAPVSVAWNVRILFGMFCVDFSLEHHFYKPSCAPRWVQEKTFTPNRALTPHPLLPARHRLRTLRGPSARVVTNASLPPPFLPPSKCTKPSTFPKPESARTTQAQAKGRLKKESPTKMSKTARPPMPHRARRSGSSGDGAPPSSFKPTCPGIYITRLEKAIPEP